MLNKASTAELHKIKKIQLLKFSPKNYPNQKIEIPDIPTTINREEIILNIMSRLLFLSPITPSHINDMLILNITVNSILVDDKALTKDTGPNESPHIIKINPTCAKTTLFNAFKKKNNLGFPCLIKLNNSDLAGELVIAPISKIEPPQAARIPCTKSTDNPIYEKANFPKINEIAKSNEESIKI